MATPLSERQRRQLAAGLALVALVYLFLIGKEFAASVFASHSDLAKLERAVRLSPGNADYRHRLGTFLAFGPGDPQAAVESYRSAVALNPYDASYWLDLAAADQVTGDLDGQRAALDRALAAEPTAPDVAWRAANYFLVDGRSIGRSANSASSSRMTSRFPTLLCMPAGACAPMRTLYCKRWCPGALTPCSRFSRC